MKYAAIASAVLLGQLLTAEGAVAFEPSSWRENLSRGSSGENAAAPETPIAPTPTAPTAPNKPPTALAPDAPPPPGSAPRAVKVARTTTIPACTSFVDTAATAGGAGTAQKPHKTIAAAAAAAKAGAVICVAQGTYAEQILPGEKAFTLAGGFQSGTGFKVRDSAAYVSKAQGSGTGSFLHIKDPGPRDNQLTAIDGFEITGYSRAIVREHWQPQRFDITNNFIHDNTCADDTVTGAGFALDNVSGTIRGNVIQNNACSRGGAGALNDGTNKNTVSIENNWVDGNAGTEPTSSHGGGLYVGANKLKVTGNLITNNSVTQWGGGLYIGAFTAGGQFVTATMEGNIYRGNKAGDSGGGFFCDEGATCFSSNEIYDRNCGGNVLVDGGAGGSGPTRATFDHVTNVGALEVGCEGPGEGLFVDTYQALAADTYSVTNSLFFGNAVDLRTACGSGCNKLKVKVDTTMAETKFKNDGIPITFGPGMVPPADPLFVDAEAGDFQLQPGSPAIGKGSGGTDLGALVGK